MYDTTPAAVRAVLAISKHFSCASSLITSAGVCGQTSERTTKDWIVLEIEAKLKLKCRIQVPTALNVGKV